MVAAPILARRTPPASPFYGGGHTGSVNNLINTAGVGGKGNLLTNNPNRDAAGKQVNPRRLDPANINDILTCDQDHGYADEQQAFHGSADGKTAAMDQFITSVGTDSGNSPTGQPCQASDVMNYYDGNTVTGLWNYASQFAMSDSSFGTTFGPSSPGAINLAAGTTGGVDKMINGADTDGDTVPDGSGGRMIDDAQPYYDDCSTRDAASLSGRNIGDNLNAAGLSWGWFQGGFRRSTSFATATGGAQPTSTFIPNQFKGKFAVKPASDQGVCNTVHPVGDYGNKDDYIPHHEPFQYYASTTNPHHLPPASLAAIRTALIEDNWSLPRIAGSFDAISGTLKNLFDFHSSHGSNSKLYLDPVTGERLGR